MEIVNTEKVLDILRNSPSLYLDEKQDGTFTSTIYADYRDKMEKKTAIELLEEVDPENPELGLWEKVDEWYQEFADYIHYDALAVVREELEESAGRHLTDDEEMEVSDILTEHLFPEYPYDHFLDQRFPVNIMIDNGDSDADFALNSVYPCWYGERGAKIDRRAGIVWLARSQGYTKTKLQNALDGEADSGKFLNSMRRELENLPNSCAVLTFLVTMSLRELLEVNADIKRGKKFFLRVPRDTMCGLFNPWDGGGSVLEIELEKDVAIPSGKIRSVLPDGGEWRYGIDEVYGMCGNAWDAEAVYMDLREAKAEAVETEKDEDIKEAA